jgi:hypothetical protein
VLEVSPETRANLQMGAVLLVAFVIAAAVIHGQYLHLERLAAIEAGVCPEGVTP